MSMKAIERALYRGKAQDVDEETGEELDSTSWVYGAYVDGFIVGDVVESTEEYIALERWCPVNIETVGQWTGLRDKDGRKIFEGDVVECVSWNEFRRTASDHTNPLRRRCLVGFHNGAFCMKEFLGHGLTPNYWPLIHNGDIEIVGNIQDNPGLLAERR